MSDAERKRMNKLLSRNFRWFVEHYDEFREKYDKKFLVVKDCAIVDWDDTIEKAQARAKLRDLPPGTYLVQECLKDRKAYMLDGFYRYALWK